MATNTLELTGPSVHNVIRKKFNKAKGSSPQGSFLVKGQVVVLPTDLDVLNDTVKLLEFPDNCRLLGASVTADKEYDTGGTALRFGLVLDSGESQSFTSAVGQAFANQPASDGVTIVSDSASDTQTATIIGTTVSTDSVVLEDIVLTGDTPVNSVKTNWGVILAIKLSSAAVGTISLKETSGSQVITTISATSTSKGVQTLTSTNYYDHLVRMVASGSSTKQLGLGGTDTDGTALYDSQALTGTTQALSNSRFATLTELYTGDLANTTTVTVSSSPALLATGSQFVTADPIPLNWSGGSLPGTEFGVDVSNQTLALLVEAAPTTGNSSNVTFTVLAHVYVGDVVDVGTSEA